MCDFTRVKGSQFSVLCLGVVVPVDSPVVVHETVSRIKNVPQTCLGCLCMCRVGSDSLATPNIGI